MNRDIIRKAVMRKFDLADLLPVETSMIDTVIDETVRQIVMAVRDYANRSANHYLHDAADRIESEFIA